MILQLIQQPAMGYRYLTLTKVIISPQSEAEWDTAYEPEVQDNSVFHSRLLDKHFIRYKGIFWLTER